MIANLTSAANNLAKIRAMDSQQIEIFSLDVVSVILIGLVAALSLAAIRMKQRLSQQARLLRKLDGMVDRLLKIDESGEIDGKRQK